MKLKLNNIAEILKEKKECLVSRDAFEEDMNPLLSYYRRNPNDSQLSEVANKGDVLEFGGDYISVYLFNVLGKISVSESNDNRLKLELV